MNRPHESPECRCEACVAWRKRTIDVAAEKALAALLADRPQCRCLRCTLSRGLVRLGVVHDLPNPRVIDFDERSSDAVQRPETD